MRVRADELQKHIVWQDEEVLRQGIRLELLGQEVALRDMQLLVVLFEVSQVRL